MTVQLTPEMLNNLISEELERFAAKNEKVENNTGVINLTLEGLRDLIKEEMARYVQCDRCGHCSDDLSDPRPSRDDEFELPDPMDEPLDMPELPSRPLYEDEAEEEVELAEPEVTPAEAEQDKRAAREKAAGEDTTPPIVVKK